MIDIFYASLNVPLEERILTDYLSFLPPDLREKNSRFIRWQDRHLHLFGKLLFLEALKLYGIEKDIWRYVEYNSNKRPCLTLNEYDFNISHSGNMVTCAIGRNIRLGIDVEENRQVDLSNFTNVMTPEQWEEIHQAALPLHHFYKYWTIKESVIKADGRGLLIPLDELHVKDQTVQYEDKLWHVQEVPMGSGYQAALATNHPSTFNMREMNFYKSVPV